MDIPRIQKEVRAKQQKFSKAYGNEIDKVFADHKLATDIAVTKIHRIAIVLKEEGVIDQIIFTSSNNPIAEITLRKNNMLTYVVVLTNGNQIKVQGYSYTTGDFEGDIGSSPIRFNNVDGEDFDWVRFSIDLVDYIHSTLYERKEVVETKISMMFKPKRR